MNIVVIDSGFVYIGEPEKVDHPILGESIKLTHSSNIRVWGTTKGLGQLAHIGKQDSTVLDFVGTITIPKPKILHFIDLSEAAKNSFANG